MGFYQCLVELPPCCQVLERKLRRLLSEQGRIVVFELSTAYPQRPHHSYSTDACVEVIAATQETEDGAHGRFRAWWIVSYGPISGERCVKLIGSSVVVTTIIRLHSLLIIARSSDPSCKCTFCLLCFTLS